MEKNLEIWRTASGETLKIVDMKTSHIQNCLKMIKSNHKSNYSDYIPVFEAELAKRGLLVDKDKIARTDGISESEMMYFLDTVTGYQFVKASELLTEFSLEPPTEKGLREYMQTSVFVLPKKINLPEWKEDFRGLLLSSHTKQSREAIYKNHEQELLLNVFTAEWTAFLGMLLGRKRED